MSGVVVTLVVGVALLALASVWALHKRSSGVSQVARQVAEKEQAVLRSSHECDEDLRHELRSGLPAEQVLDRHVERMRKLLPEKMGNSLWGPEDLPNVSRQWLEEGVARVNHRILMPFAVAAVFIGLGTATVSFLCYSFSAQGNGLASPAATPLPAGSASFGVAPAAAPADPFQGFAGFAADALPVLAPKPQPHAEPATPTAPVPGNGNADGKSTAPLVKNGGTNG